MLGVDSGARVELHDVSADDGISDWYLAVFVDGLDLTSQ